MRTIQAPPLKLLNVLANANQGIEHVLKIHVTTEGMALLLCQTDKKDQPCGFRFLEQLDLKQRFTLLVQQRNDTNAAEGMPVYRQNGIKSWRRERDSNRRCLLSARNLFISQKA